MDENPDKVGIGERWLIGEIGKSHRNMGMRVSCTDKFSSKSKVVIFKVDPNDPGLRIGGVNKGTLAPESSSEGLAGSELVCLRPNWQFVIDKETGDRGNTSPIQKIFQQTVDSYYIITESGSTYFIQIERPGDAPRENINTVRSSFGKLLNMIRLRS